MQEITGLVAKEEVTLEKFDNETGKLVEKITIVDGKIVSKEEF